MRSILVTILLLLACVATAPAQDAASTSDRTAIESCLQKQKDTPDHCIGIVYAACNDEAGGGTTYSMGVCAQRETQVWQEMIDASLRQLIVGALGTTQAEPHNRPNENKRNHAVPGSDIIADMQRTWLVWRAKMCDTLSMQYEGGSLSRVVYGTCVYEETGRHALWLKALAADVR
jgi:uncharacterized protein YecT (DUF1311 family)